MKWFKGVVKYLLNRFVLQPIYKYPKWHNTPIERKQYALDTLEFINGKLIPDNSTIVEVGCGKGDIISRIHGHRLIGYEPDETILKFARKIHKNVEFRTGMFSDVRESPIDLCIAVNVLHCIEPKELKRSFDSVFANCDVKAFVVDALRNIEGTSYLHAYDFADYMEEGYLCKDRITSQAVEGAERYIEYWVKE